MKFIALLLFTCVISTTNTTQAASSVNADQFVAMLTTTNHVALMRHAIAPGMGDPINFTIDDCQTQRNLDDQGRIQAQNIGDSLRDNHSGEFIVFSSQWCRCLETAEHLNLGQITELELLNSFFQRPQLRDNQTQKLIDWISRQPLTKPTILVTHQVNITALSGIYPASGEIVLMKRDPDGALQVVSTLKSE